MPELLLSADIRSMEPEKRGVEILKRIPELLYESMVEGTSPSMTLELADPSTDWMDIGDGRLSRIDGFERACREAGLITKTDMARGIYASKFHEFLGSQEGRALFLIYAQREWAASKYGSDVNTRDILTSVVDNVAASQRPYLDAALREDLEGRAELEAPIQELIAVDTPIKGRSYQAIYMDESASQMGFHRVTEGAEIGRSILKLSEATFHLAKYGDALEWTYEVDRQEGIDKIGFFIRKLSQQNEYDKLSEIVTTLVNHALVETLNLSDLDDTVTPAAGNAMTFRALVSLQMEFNRGYVMNTVLGDKAAMLDMLMTPTGPDTESLIAAGETPIGSFRKLGTQASGDLVWSNVTDVAADTLVFFDRRSALERISEIGSTISEMDDFITSQRKVMTFTENEDYNVIVPASVKIVDTAA